MMGRVGAIFAMLLFTAMFAGQAAAADWSKAPYRLGKTAPPPDMSVGSLIVVPFTFRNDYKPGKGLQDFSLHFVRLDANLSDYFTFDAAPKQLAAGDYFASLIWLTPGKYRIDRVGGFGGNRVIGFAGQMSFTLDIQFEVPRAGEVIYLGRNDLVNVVKRSRDDQGTGFPTPMIEQMLWGFGDGTLNASVQDKAEEDWAIYTGLFPQLKDWQPRTQLPVHYLLDRAVTSRQPSINVFAPLPAPTPESAYGPSRDPSIPPSESALPAVVGPASAVQVADPAPPASVEPVGGARTSSPPASVTETSFSLFRSPHTHAVPPPSGFAAGDSIEAVPVRPEGKDRYRHYLTLPSPKAFVVYETGGWRFWFRQADAMTAALNFCAREYRRCWLYAVDNNVVWQADPDKRIGRTDQLPR